MKWSEKHFAGRGEGVDPDTTYECGNAYEFRAGSYSVYNEWRDMLNDFKGTEAFQELINFADNEGVIGLIVSKKLYKDFQKYEAEAESAFDDSYFYTLYVDWKKAFELASQNGAVQFC